MITIVEPANPERVATATRENLQELVRRANEAPAESVVDLTKEEIKVIKDKAALAFTGDETTEAALSICIRAALIVATGVTEPEYFSKDSVTYSYALEGAFNQVRRLKFSKDLAANCSIASMVKEGYDAAFQNISWAGVLEVPHSTTGAQDAYVHHGVAKILQALQVLNPGHTVYLNGQADNTNIQLEVPYGDWVVPYPTEDGPWVAGIVDYQDLGKAKFIRQRLGAYLTSKGLTDGDVRTVVERHKRILATGDFTVYPNDIPWGYVYSDECNVGSCMSGEAGSYSGHIHPIDAYSSKYYDSGDNSLVLVVSADRDSRAILNTKTWQYVRFYGQDRHQVALDALGCEDSSNALTGSWLALIIDENDSEQFIAPYVDGSIDQGEVDVEAGRVYLHRSGGVELSETCGTYSAGALEEQVTCIVDGEQYPRSICTFLDGEDEYAHDSYYTEWHTCSVTGLDYLDTHLTQVRLDGKDRRVNTEWLEENAWCDASGDYWNDAIECVLVDGEPYRESECRQKKDGEWVLIDDYVEEDDEAA